MMSSRGGGSGCCGVSLRRLHLYAAWLGALPVMLSAASGMAYRLARSAGVEKVSIRWMLRVHTVSSHTQADRRSKQKLATNALTRPFDWLVW